MNGEQKELAVLRAAKFYYKDPGKINRNRLRKVTRELVEHEWKKEKPMTKEQIEALERSNQALSDKCCELNLDVVACGIEIKNLNHEIATLKLEKKSLESEKAAMAKKLGGLNNG